MRILEENFPDALNGKRIICLNIPDVYRYMEPALIDELKAALSEHIQLPSENAEGIVPGTFLSSQETWRFCCSTPGTGFWTWR